MASATVTPAADRANANQSFDLLFEPVQITSREPDESLWRTLLEKPDSLLTLRRIGDCRAPGLIAAAVHDGHLAAREFDLDPAPVRRDYVKVQAEAAPVSA